MTMPQSPPATIDLVRAAQAGDAVAWGIIHERYALLVRVVVHGRIPDKMRARFDTDDVLQSGFLRAFEQIGRYEDQGEDAFRRWLTTLISHRLTDKVRYHLRERRDSGRDEAELESTDLRRAPDGADSPGAIVAAAERIARILAALHKLDAADQELMSMRLFDKLTWADIAERLAIGETTARRRFYETFERLVDKVT